LALNYLVQRQLPIPKSEKNNQVDQMKAEQFLNRVKFLHTCAKFGAPGFDFAKYVNRFIY
jgi:hypothetical protein